MDDAVQSPDFPMAGFEVFPRVAPGAIFLRSCGRSGFGARGHSGRPTARSSQRAPTQWVPRRGTVSAMRCWFFGGWPGHLRQVLKACGDFSGCFRGRRGKVWRRIKIGRKKGDLGCFWTKNRAKCAWGLRGDFACKLIYIWWLSPESGCFSSAEW